MKLFNTLLSLQVAAALMLGASACDDSDNVTDYSPTLEIVAYNSDTFGGQGGTLQLLVSSNADYTTGIDVDWIIPAESRAAMPANAVSTFTIAPYGTALDNTPRTGTITFKSETTGSVTFTVSQVPGELFKFEITDVSTHNIPAKGGNIEVTVQTNMDYTVDLSKNDWVTIASAAAGKYTFAVAENKVTQPRTGTITFVTDGLGDFDVTFMQDPYVEAKGISTALQLVEFANAVNSGLPLEQWMDENEEVVLLNDIDMSGTVWTPIGNITGSTIANGTPTLGDGNPFKGVFNGQGHRLTNLAMSTDDAQLLGLFGACQGAVIKNLVIDSSCTMQVANESLKCGSMYGFIAGIAVKTTVENCKVYGTVKESLINKGGTKYMACIAGFAGFAQSATFKDCEFAGTMERVRSNVYDNSLGSGVAGIVGYCVGETSSPTVLENCVNSGYIHALTNRVGGILGGTNGNYRLTGCTNAGVVHAGAAEASAAGWTSGLRVGGVMAFSSNTKTTNVAAIENCTNSGTVLCEGDAKTVTGALLGNPRCFTLTNGVNSGTLIDTAGGISGLLIGQLACGDKPTIVSAKCGGKVATAFTGTGLNIAPVSPVAVTAENYFNFATGTITGTNSGVWTVNNVTFLAQ